MATIPPRPVPNWDAQLALIALGLLILLAGAALFFTHAFKFDEPNYPDSYVWWGLLAVAVGVALMAASSYLKPGKDE